MILLKRHRKIPLRAKDIMSEPPITATLETTIAYVASLMRKNGIGSVLIVDEKGVLRGIVTERDIVFASSEGWNPKEHKAWEIMTENPITVSPEDDIITVIRKMRDVNIRHLPVVKDNEPVGVISIRDILDVIWTLAGLGLGLTES